MSRQSFLSQQTQRGIGLIELMISVTLGLFLLSGAIGVLYSSKSSYNMNNDLTWIQDNARFASTLLNKDVRMAGFYGCSTSQGFASTLNDDPSGTSWYTDFDKPISGWDGDETNYPQPEFPAPYETASLAALPKSDLFTIRRADDSDIKVDDNYPPTSAVIHIEGRHPYEKGEILVITDCEQTTVFQFTGNANNVVGHNSGGSVVPGNCTKLLGRNRCSQDKNVNAKIFYGEDGAFIVKMKSHAYYVATGADGNPALFRRELTARGGSAALDDEEIIQGVENVQVVYGLDSNGDGVANRYLDAADVVDDDWPQVVTVRLHLLLRSFAEVATEAQTFRFLGDNYTPDDRFLRQEFISTIELRNRG